MEDNKVKQTDFGLIGFRATYTADNTNMYIAPSIKKETNLKPKCIGLVVSSDHKFSTYSGKTIIYYMGHVQRTPNVIAIIVFTTAGQYFLTAPRNLSTQNSINYLDT